MKVSQQDGRKVAIVLMKSPEADATIEVLKADAPHLSVEDNTSYFTIAGLDEITIDMDRVSEELGESITLSQWLVIMSSYIGRVTPDDTHFRVTSDMLQMG